ncbi:MULTISPECIES: hypothetical protein [Microbacterium]|uniref:Major facilitator superfamily (MFS) profile domain-containing protein n=1 Tax=Microbacterium wangchenii TaxID=2541726 RepID=A0ABX5SX99_9MICO|nr:MULTISPECIES: hypothetical protein [Microbacterium]MCK6067170.1 hypothetical protein [Microbacterium sp. EYE_512]QBR89875.1 hypothetical protein E4K62_14995 [Microbacterium wangchenii]TFV85267.1 hypothetical protein E4V99_09735 [Microbacterium sp. dk485]TXK16528.1 hypothetical protein FVP99_07520 [Microbacterium wangchenii]
MEDARPVRRPRAAAVIGIIVGALFLALGAAALLIGLGLVIGVIALVGGALTLAAAVFLLVRP